MPLVASSSGCNKSIVKAAVVWIWITSFSGFAQVQGFQPAVAYSSSGYKSSSVAVADVNGDGKPDLVMASLCTDSNSCNSGAVDVFLGNGDGTFRAPASYSSGGVDAESVAIADVNGDGKPDVLVANVCSAPPVCNSGAVGVLLGNGDGTFQPAVAYPSGGFPYSVAVADLNGDGKPDLVVASPSASNNTNDPGIVGVLLGNGDGTFQPVVTYGTGAFGNHYVVIADVNGDLKPDLIVANECIAPDCYQQDGRGVIGVLLGNGDGTFQPAMTYDSGGYFAVSISVADVNGDSKPDLIVADECISSGNCGNGGAVAVLLGNGNGSFQSAVTYASDGYSADSVVAEDVNGDGKLDIVVANCASSSSCVSSFAPAAVGSVLFGNGDGTFQSALSFSTGGFDALFIAVADVNGDARPDLLVVNDCASRTCTTGSVGVLLNGPWRTTLSTYSSGTSEFLQPITLFADVTSNAGFDKQGTATFTDGSTLLGTSAVNSSGVGTLVISSLAVGMHPISVAYSGNANYLSSSSGFTQMVNKASTKPVVTSSANPALINEPVTFTVNVIGAYGGTPTGTVTFSEFGIGVIATETLSGATASFTTSFAAAGTYKIWATYKGDTNFLGSVGLSLSEKINKFPTSTTVTSNLNPSSYGQAVRFTATVNSAYGGPTGTVTFRRGTTALGTVPLSGNTATFTTSALNAGTNYINAVYGGDPNFATSTSPNLNQVVKKLATTTALSSSPNPSALGQTVTFNATVSAALGTPTGTVTFKKGLTVLGTAALSGGVATFSTSSLPSGSNSITARYGGSTNYQPSNSATLTQIVQ